MSLFPLQALLLSTLIQFSWAVPDVRPTLTAVYGEGGQALQRISPRPTDIPSDPRRLFRRAIPNDVCGYASANIYSPFTCYNDEFCGVRTDLGVVGCCTSYSLMADGEYTLAGCTFRTVCYGSTETTRCTGTCSNDPRVAYCTDSDYPYCMTYTYTDVGLSYYRCAQVAGVTTKVAETYTTQTSSPATTTAVTTSANVATASVTTIITTTYASAGSSILSVVTSKPVVVVTSSTSLSVGDGGSGTQVQNQAGSNTTPTSGDGGAIVSASPAVLAGNTTQRTSTPLGAIIGGAVGGFVAVVGAIALWVFLCLKHKRSKKDNTGTGAGGAAYVANNTNANNNHNHKPTSAAGMKAPEPVIAATKHDQENLASPPPSYQSPQTQQAHMMVSPQPNHGYMSPNRSEMDGRAISPTPHSTGRSELASPSMTSQEDPRMTGTDHFMSWNRLCRGVLPKSAFGR